MLLTVLVCFITLSAWSLARSAAPERKHGLELTGMDPSVKPYEDFYQFANGKWLARTQIPADRPMAGTAVSLRDRNRDVLHQILDEAGRDTAAARESAVAKVGAFYRSGMDEAHIEAAGAKPLQAEFERIAQIADAASVLQELARLHGHGVAALFGLGPIPDFKDSARMIAGLHQGGLGMPDRDYYLKTDDKTKAIR
ncbi:MAG TPA: M13 family metallopeptidase N-terminal domain-containing protein, partial [Gemmataceae bacterium]|nr:M13 family metallopeptidase N-terminal domain-containing protein [Gemmataceae bacterium]